MPTYTYRCERCDVMRDEIRRIDARHDVLHCSCGEPMYLVIVAPSVTVWNTERRFPNLRKDGDGSMAFGSKTEYEGYLKQNQIGELGIRAPIKRPHGTKVIGTWR